MSNEVKLDGIEIVHETDNAILIRYADIEDWIPLSQVSKITRHIEPGRSSIVAAEWILNKKGFV